MKIFRFCLLFNFFPTLLFSLSGLTSALSDSACLRALEEVTGKSSLEREDEITSGHGESFKLHFQSGSKEFDLEGNVQPEYEKRININLKIGDKGTNGGAFLEFIKNTIHYFNDRLYGITIRPLDQNAKVYHQGGLIQKKSKLDDLKESPFTKIIEGRSYVVQGKGHGDGDLVEPNYKIGIQWERSVYFDDATGKLRSEGLALRIKEWRPVGEAIDRPFRRMLFLKVTHPEVDQFNYRQEYQIPIEDQMTSEEIRSAAAALIKHVRPDLVILQQHLAPVIELHNERIGLDLRHFENLGQSGRLFAFDGDQGRKVGFITFDRYTSMTPENRLLKAPETFQIEIEILPQYSQLISTSQKDLSALAQYFLTNSSGKVDNVPKFIQGSHKLTKTLQATGNQSQGPPGFERFSAQEVNNYLREELLVWSHLSQSEKDNFVNSALASDDLDLRAIAAGRLGQTSMPISEIKILITSESFSSFKGAALKSVAERKSEGREADLIDTLLFESLADDNPEVVQIAALNIKNRAQAGRDLRSRLYEFLNQTQSVSSEVLHVLSFALSTYGLLETKSLATIENLLKHYAISDGGKRSDVQFLITCLTFQAAYEKMFGYEERTRAIRKKVKSLLLEIKANTKSHDDTLFDANRYLYGLE